jgi:precorrin-6B methylase 2
VALNKIHQEVSNLGLAGLVIETVIGHGFSASDIIDANNQRLEMMERLIQTYIHKEQSQDYNRQTEHTDFQIQIAHHRRSDLLNVMPPGPGKFVLGQRRKLSGAH